MNNITFIPNEFVEEYNKLTKAKHKLEYAARVMAKVRNVDIADYLYPTDGDYEECCIIIKHRSVSLLADVAALCDNIGIPRDRINEDWGMITIYFDYSRFIDWNKYKEDLEYKLEEEERLDSQMQDPRNFHAGRIMEIREELGLIESGEFEELVNWYSYEYWEDYLK